MDQSADRQQQIEVDVSTDSPAPLTAFFAIGIFVNLVLITAFALWAIRQWKRSDRRGPPNSED